VQRIAIVSWLCLGACASTRPDSPISHHSVGSGYSSGSPESERRFDETGVRMTSDLQAGLVVRPDMLVMEVRIQKDDANAGGALALAQLAVADLTTRLQRATSGAAMFIPCGTQVTPVGGKGQVAATAGAFRVLLEGRIEVALAPQLDYWKRSALVVALAEVADWYEAARAAKTPDRGVSLSRTQVIVKNPESYRGKLTDLWVQRARAFAAAAQTREAPLYLLDCAPPGDIVQKQRSLEEIALSLSVTCRLGSLKAPPGALPTARSP
jgi:hypothetical protein